MTEIVIATRNAHKVGEIRGILGTKFRILSQHDFPGAPPVAEDAATFSGNAAKKAEGLAAWLELQPTTAKLNEHFYVLADDSGLEVDALGGAPGVHSARFAANDEAGTTNSPDADNNAKLLRLLEGVPSDRRMARFRCVLALAARGKTTLLFGGHCEGRIAFAAAGAGGFGYDPLFVPEGFVESFAELGEEVKNKISHRARALAQLRQFLDGIN
ncbi:MAG TPA: non-canonical purine NTP pyrophosphatase [Verrucomicrobiae bacterium]|jgi:XTP/dITP diphosphohydrolase|nr:non-canonical purine NTP pyrophosphatase [Verrucomicrobiae bacterium]